MTIRDIIKEAKKHKCRISNEELRYYCQSTKTLVYWLLEAEGSTGFKAQELVRMLTSDQWELDFTFKK